MSLAKNRNSEQIVLDRRLKPIYEAIDYGYNEIALKEADKVLKKHPKTLAAKALKALALVRLERVRDAVPVMTELEKAVEDNIVSDDNTVQALCHCLKESSLPERIPKVYLHLVQRHPKNEDYLAHLFMAYARLRDYDNQQKIAVHLCKDFPSPRYGLWTVTTVMMKALTDPKLGPEMFWKLAEGMIAKWLKNNTPTAEAVDLQIRILEGRGKPLEALEVLNDEKFSAIFQRPRMPLFKKGIDLQMAGGNVPQVPKLLMDVLEKEPDEWWYWEQLLDCTFKVYDGKDNPESNDRLLNDVVEFVLAGSNNAKRDKLRAPLLAHMDLLQRLAERSIQRPGLGDSLELFTTYTDLFHLKPCCYVDIRKFLPNLSGDDRRRLIAHLDVSINKYECPNKATTTLLREKVKRVYGLHEDLSKQQARDLVGELLFLAHEHCQSDAVNASGLVLMGVHVLWDVYLREKDMQVFMELLLLLEYGRYTHISDATSKLLLMRMYAYVGCVHIVENLQRELDIKYVQKDSMTYYLLPLQEQFGCFHRAIYHNNQLSSYFDHTDREVCECIVNAFKTGAYTKVPSLVELQKRCEKSITSLYSDVSNRLMSACFGIKDLNLAVEMLEGDSQPIDFDSLVDNRDLYVIPNFDPEDTKTKTEQLKDATFKEMVDYAKLKQLLCRFVAALYHADTTKVAMLTKRSDLLDHLIYCMEKYPENAEREPTRPLQAPTDIRLGIFVHSGVVQLVIKILENAGPLIDLHQAMEGDTVKAEYAEQCLKQILELLPKPEDLLSILTRIVPMDMDISKPFSVHEFFYKCHLSAFCVSLGGIALQILEGYVKKLYGLAASVAALGAVDLKSKDKKQKVNKKKNKQDEFVEPFEKLREPLRNCWRIYTGFLSELTVELKKDQADAPCSLYPKLDPEAWSNKRAFEILTELEKNVHEGITKAYLEGTNDIIFSSSGKNGAFWIL